MSIIPATLNFEPHYKGSSLLPLHIKTNFDITGATILCQIKLEPNAPAIHQWITGSNITIIDALTGEFTLNQIDEFDPEPGKYIYDLQIKFADGTSETYLKGKICVIQDISRQYGN
jgi:hypothetical protein